LTHGVDRLEDVQIAGLRGGWYRSDLPKRVSRGNWDGEFCGDVVPKCVSWGSREGRFIDDVDVDVIVNVIGGSRH
jgi:hypothetical protein